MSNAPPPPRRLVLAYDPAYRATMSVSAEEAENPEVLRAAVAALPPPSRALLDLLLLVAPAGEPLPERLRDRVAKAGGPLWQAALLLPRASSWQEGSLHPQHYAGSCRLNPGLQGTPYELERPLAEAVPGFPPADVRWDAVVVAAALEANPAALTQDGVLRRDVERRLYTQLGDDDHRWSLALRYGRAAGLIRATGGKLHGLPEAHSRPVADVAGLCPSAAATAAASLVLRLLTTEWTPTSWLLELLGGAGREALFSPVSRAYPQRSETFDDAGFLTVEVPAIKLALDVLHRVGTIDAARDADGVTVFRRAEPRPRPPGGFILTPDGSILCHVAELRPEVYGRLARLAPFVDGDALRRHRLTRDGIVAELGAGHKDTLEFLTEHSRTGVAPNVVDQIREWQRSATRLAILSGVDILEEPDGRLRIAIPGEAGRVIDYTTRPRARFVAYQGKLVVPDGWDSLDVRAALDRVANYIGREGDTRVWEPTRRPHRNAEALLGRLREFHGGDLPGDLETLIVAGSGIAAAEAVDAVIVRLPVEVAAALRRDRVAGPLLRRILGPLESVVSRPELPALRARLAELGVTWEGVD